MERLILTRAFTRHVCLANRLYIFPVFIPLIRDELTLSSYVSYSPPVVCANKEDVCDFCGKSDYSTAMPYTEA